MKINIFLLLFSLFSIVLAVPTEPIPAKLDGREKGSTCVEIYSNGKDAYILVELYQLGFTLNLTDGQLLSLPIAIFKYSHIAYYEGFPTLNEFNHMYLLGEGDIMYNKLLNLNTSEITNSYLIKTLGSPTMYVDNFIKNGQVVKSAVKMKVKESGIYCVYVATPIETAIYGRMSGKVSYRNSYGYLPYSLFVFYRYLIFSSIIGVLFFIIIYYYMSKQPKTLNGIGDFSGIYKALLFYCLIPFIIDHSMDILVCYIKSIHYHDGKFNKEASFFFYLFNTGFREMVHILVFDYLPMILLLNYGLFYISPGSKLKIPTYFWRITANLLFFLNALSFTVASYYVTKRSYKIIKLHTVLQSSIETLIFLHKNQYFWYLWKAFHLLGLGLVAITKNSTLKDPSIFKNISRSLQLTFFVGNFTHSILKGAITCLFSMQLYYQFTTDDAERKMNMFGYAHADEIMTTLSQEFVIFKLLGAYTLYVELGNYLLIFLIFLIWLRTSNVIFKKSTIRETKNEEYT